MISQWKKSLLDSAANVFERSGKVKLSIDTSGRRNMVDPILCTAPKGF